MGVNRERREKSGGGFARSIEVGAGFMVRFTIAVEVGICGVWVTGEQDDGSSATTSVGVGAFEGL